MKKVIIGAVCLAVSLASTYTESRAEADIGFKGVGGRLSLVSPDNIDMTFGFGGVFDFGTFAPQVGFGATIDAWFGSEGAGSFSVDYRDIIIGVNSKYYFKTSNEKLKPYAGGGLAMHFFTFDLPSFDFFGQSIGGSETDTKFGIDLLGGLNYAAGENIDITGEAMYRVVSDIGQFVISGGIIYYFGGGDSGE